MSVMLRQAGLTYGDLLLLDEGCPARSQAVMPLATRHKAFVLDWPLDTHLISQAQLELEQSLILLLAWHASGRRA